MSDEQALLAAIFDHPDEDTPRLAYADWLDEHADALPGRDPQEVRDRAAFIRLQIEAERLPAGAKRAAVEKRIRALPKPHLDLWYEPYRRAYGGDYPPLVPFRRGFIDRFRGTPADAPRFTEVAAVCPIQDVVFSVRTVFPSIDFGPMAACPALVRVRRIDFEHLVPEFTQEVLPSPHLTGLRTLRITWGAGSTHDAVEAASASSVAAGLRELWVDGARGALVPGAGLGTLLSAEWPTLESVRIDRAEMGDAGVRTLATDFTARGRRALHVYDQRLTPAGARSVVEAALAGSLRSLSLACSRDVGAWLRGEEPDVAPPDARELRLEGFYNDGDAPANWLVATVPPGRFDRLGLVGGRMSWGGLRVLLGWAGLPHLKELDVSNNWIGDNGAKELAKCPHLDGLEALYVAHNDVTKTGKDALKGRFGRRVRVS